MRHPDRFHQQPDDEAEQSTGINLPRGVSDHFLQGVFRRYLSFEKLPQDLVDALCVQAGLPADIGRIVKDDDAEHCRDGKNFTVKTGAHPRDQCQGTDEG